MNRRMIVLAVAGFALLAFAGGAFVYSNRGGDQPPEAILNAPSIEEIQTPAQPSADESPPVSASQSTATTAAPPVAEPRWTAYVREHSPVIGAPNARVTIVEFFDPACEACRAFYPVVHEILRRHPNDVRLVLRYTPLHEGSEEASRIIETARLQNRLEPVLTALFQQQPQWAAHGSPRIDLAWNAAASAGLDVNAARAAMNERHISAALQQDQADIAALNVRGTPTFFVNERPLTNFGAQPLYDLVLEELAATQ